MHSVQLPLSIPTNCKGRLLVITSHYEPKNLTNLSHFRGATFPVHLGRLRQEICTVRRAGQAHPDTHGGEELHLSGLQQALHEIRPPEVRKESDALIRGDSEVVLENETAWLWGVAATTWSA